MLLDFFIKRIGYQCLSYLYLNYCLVFSEKFFIEELFFKVKYFVKYCKSITTQFSVSFALQFFMYVNIFYIIFLL